MTIFERALGFIADGDAVGLGSGHAAAEFIRLLAERVRSGLRVRAVATSRESERLAVILGIGVVPLKEAMPLALTVDGADEVDPRLNLIKGYGRALVREKVVAAASRRLVILAGHNKEVAVLGTRGKLPVEVVPFALPLVSRRLGDLGLKPVLWEQGGGPLVTDNGNHILDCGTGPIADPAALEARLRDVPGVVGTGLFLGMADTVLIGDEDDHFRLTQERQRNAL
jgi:ribose 5-phosphate isomerase A